MNDAGQRPLRADAARNVNRMVQAAWAGFEEEGPDVRLEEIARRAGVGVATLYRHFANKEELIRAVLQDRFAQQVEPVLQGALADADPWHGLVTALESALALASSAYNTLTAVRDPAATVAGVADRYFDMLAVLVRRAQDVGLVRADLVADDLPRILLMLIGVMRLEDGPSDSWRRYLALLLDALRPAAATSLPAPPAPAPPTGGEPARNAAAVPAPTVHG